MFIKMMTVALISHLLFVGTVGTVCVGKKSNTTSNNLIVLSDILNMRYFAIIKEALEKERFVKQIRESSHHDIYNKIKDKIFI